ncbi:MAG: hypothetical protein ACJ8AT_03765 [Hyalangium sp.]|uniref:hypothetical protein n=1 Tax=Hyalangium sp. TaxID=2028555 RepID=UPI003899FAB7
MTFRTLSRIGALLIAAVLCLGHSDNGGCGGGGDEEHEGVATGATCPPTDAPTAQSFGTAFLQTYCLYCHSASVTGDARHDAPTDTNFDTLDEVRMHAMHMDMHAAAGPITTNTEMPPAGRLQPTQLEREKLGEWLACGAP